MRFRGIKSIEAEERRQLFRQILHYETVLARAFLVNVRMASIISLGLLFPVNLAIMVGLGGTLVHWMGFDSISPSAKDARPWISIPLMFVFTLVLFTPILQYFRKLVIFSGRGDIKAREERQIRNLQQPALVLRPARTAAFLIISVLAAKWLPFSAESQPHIYGGILGAIVAILGWVAFLTQMKAMDLLVWFLERRTQRRHPDAVLADTLLQILSRLECKPQRWNAIGSRRWLISRLEEAATCVELSLPCRWAARDVGTELWIREISGQMAAALRAKKRWVITPRPDTRDILARSIASSLQCVLSGNWDGLERVTPVAVSPSMLWTFRLARLARATTAAGFPMVVLFALQQTPMALKDPIADYAKIGALVWAFISVLMMADPFYAEKISAVRDIAHFLSGTAKPNDKLS